MTEPLVVNRDDRTGEPVAAADGLEKTVLIDEGDGAETGAIRRFSLAPGGHVPRHTNAVEHLQYVLAGSYTVGLGETTHTVAPGDALLVPAGTVHWYRNEGNEPGSFICVVPPGNDEIQVLE